MNTKVFLEKASQIMSTCNVPRISKIIYIYVDKDILAKQVYFQQQNKFVLGFIAGPQ